MRRTLKQLLVEAEKSRDSYIEQLRAAEEKLRQILKRRRFNRGQRKALQELVKMVHIPGLIERLNKIMFGVYAGAVEAQMNRPAVNPGLRWQLSPSEDKPAEEQK